MKSLILDTHIFIWATQKSNRIKPKIWKLLEDERNLLFVSAASLWETAYLLDTRPKEFKIDKPLADFWNESLQEMRVQILNITPEHAQRFYEIQPIKDHFDQFDRMIIAQAASTGIPVVSNDGKFPAYKMIQLIENI